VRTVAAEALLTAVFGALLGIAFGLLAARLFARPYMLEMSGFLMPFAVPWRALGIALAASVALGLAAAVVPARRAAALPVAEALRWE
jgi:putative ABC transport system permease protein